MATAQSKFVSGALAAAAALLLAGSASTAGTPLVAPSPLAPVAGASSQTLPAFAWSPVAGAARYEFQFAADVGFNAPVLGKGEDQFFTRNSRATLKKTVPNGTYYWRVRAVSADGSVSPWSAPRQLRKGWTLAPALQAPAHGAVVSHPTSPLVLRWAAVPHAAKYLVTIASDPLLGSAVGGQQNVETSGTVYAPRALLLPPGTYYWGVTPMDAQDHRGQPSPVQSFTWTWPTVTTPAVSDLMAETEVFDPFFSWTSVAGAAKYELEVNPTADFSPGSKVCCTGTIIGSSHSPTSMLRDNTYYWRVRALDAFGNAGQWNLGSSFTKTFDKVPPVTAPSIKNLRMRDNLSDPGADVDGGTAGYQTEVPILTWSPVPGASSYEVDVWPFENGICDWGDVDGPEDNWRIKTATTSWTMLGSSWGGVKPYPDAHTVSTDGNHAPVAGKSYCARVRARADRDSSSQEVYGEYAYLDDGTGNSFTWVGSPAGGACSPSCNAGNLGSDDYVLPATGVTTTRMPLFTWKPLAGKNSYYVLVAKDPSFSNIVDYAFTQQPAYAPRTSSQSTTYSDEETLYYWAVLPANSANGDGAVGNPLLAAPENFQKLSNPPSQLAPSSGADVNGQPTFQWASAEGARRYRLQVSNDPSFGTVLDDVQTASTAYTSATSYPADTVLYWRVRADDENLVGLRWSSVGNFQRRLPVPSPRFEPSTGDMYPLIAWNPVAGAVSYQVAIDEPDGDHAEYNDFRSAAASFGKMTGTGILGVRVRANFPTKTGQATSGPVVGDVAVHAHDGRADWRAHRRVAQPPDLRVGSEAGHEALSRPGRESRGLRNDGRKRGDGQHVLRAAADVHAVPAGRHVLVEGRRLRRGQQRRRLHAPALVHAGEDVGKPPGRHPGRAASPPRGQGPGARQATQPAGRDRQGGRPRRPRCEGARPRLRAQAAVARDQPSRPGGLPVPAEAEGRRLLPGDEAPVPARHPPRSRPLDEDVRRAAEDEGVEHVRRLDAAQRPVLEVDSGVRP